MWFHPTRLETRTEESSAYASRRCTPRTVGVSESNRRNPVFGRGALRGHLGVPIPLGSGSATVGGARSRSFTGGGKARLTGRVCLSPRSLNRCERLRAGLTSGRVRVGPHQHECDGIPPGIYSEYIAPNGGSLGSPVEEDRSEPREGT